MKDGINEKQLQEQDDSTVESSFIYAGIVVAVVGFGAAAYFTKLINTLMLDSGITKTIIIWSWILFLVSVTSIDVYFFFLSSSYKRKILSTKRAVMEREAIIDYAPVGIFTYDRKGVIDTINQEMASMWGEQIIDIAGKVDVFTHPPFLEAGVVTFFTKSLDGMPRQMDAELRDKNGNARWYGFHTGPIMSPDGRTIDRVAVMVEDITGRKRVESERAKFTSDLEDVVRQRTVQLFESQKRLFAVLDNAPVMLWTTNKEMIITLSMGNGLAALDVQPGEHVGTRVEELYKERPEIIENHKKALAGQESSSVLNLGKARYLAHFAPLKNEKGEISGVIGVALELRGNAT